MAPASEAVAGADERSIDELRMELAPRIAAAAVFDGWTSQAVATAAAETGIDPDVAGYIFRDGAMSMIDAWIENVDQAMAAGLPVERLAAMSVRERIRALVLFRLEAIAGLEEALRRATAIMAMPRNLRRAFRIGWRSADGMWRLAGDTATDLNHYSKRTILAGVYAATLAVFTDDRDAGKAETRAFLDRRIGDIIRFEKAKAKWSAPGERRFSVARMLGRLRYPAQ